MSKIQPKVISVQLEDGSMINVPIDPNLPEDQIPRVLQRHIEIVTEARRKGPLQPTDATPPAVDQFADWLRSKGMIAGGLTDLGVGAAKGLGETSTNIVQAIPGLRNLTVSPEQSAEMLKPEGTMQSIGKTAEGVGEYMYGGRAAAGLLRKPMIKAAIKLPSALDRTGMAAAKMIPEMVGASATAAVHTNEDPKLAATFAALTPSAISIIGRLAEANPESAARLIQAMGLGGIVGAPQLWEKFASALGLAVKPEAIERLGQALQHINVKMPLSRAITGKVTQTGSRLEGFNQLPQPQPQFQQPEDPNQPLQAVPFNPQQ